MWVHWHPWDCRPDETWPVVVWVAETVSKWRRNGANLQWWQVQKHLWIVRHHANSSTRINSIMELKVPHAADKWSIKGRPSPRNMPAHVDWAIRTHFSDRMQIIISQFGDENGKCNDKVALADQPSDTYYRVAQLCRCCINQREAYIDWPHSAVTDQLANNITKTDCLILRRLVRLRQKSPKQNQRTILIAIIICMHYVMPCTHSTMTTRHY